MSASYPDIFAEQGRVERHTSSEAKSSIESQAWERVGRYELASKAEINARIAELRREWDIERVLEVNASTITLLGLGLGAFVNRKWFALPAVLAGFLLQHAVHGWCPPLSVFRKLGVRTAEEIHREILALKIMRGDFGERTTAFTAMKRASLTGSPSFH